jgi:anti-sigma factor RsiW
MDPMDFEHLADTILLATSGKPCRAAEEQLCAFLDGELPALDAELVRGHLEGCAGCAALAHALVHLAETLPAIQEVDPGRAFTAAVIARTSGSRRSRFAAGFRAMLLRPSFALEGAYLGSLVVVGLVAIPGSPLKQLPERAAHTVVATAGEVEERRRDLDARASSALQGAEERAERLAARVKQMKQDIERRIDDTMDAMKKQKKETS